MLLSVGNKMVSLAVKLNKHSTNMCCCGHVYKISGTLLLSENFKPDFKPWEHKLVSISDVNLAAQKRKRGRKSVKSTYRDETMRS